MLFCVKKKKKNCDPGSLSCRTRALYDYDYYNITKSRRVAQREECKYSFDSHVYAYILYMYKHVENSRGCRT